MNQYYYCSQRINGTDEKQKSRKWTIIPDFKILTVYKFLMEESFSSSGVTKWNLQIEHLIHKMFPKCENNIYEQKIW